MIASTKFPIEYGSVTVNDKFVPIATPVFGFGAITASKSISSI